MPWPAVTNEELEMFRTTAMLLGRVYAIRINCFRMNIHPELVKGEWVHRPDNWIDAVTMEDIDQEALHDRRREYDRYLQAVKDDKRTG